VFIGRGGVAVGARAAFHGCVATRVRVLCAVRANACASGRDAKCGHGVNASHAMVEVFFKLFRDAAGARDGDRLAFARCAGADAQCVAKSA